MFKKLNFKTLIIVFGILLVLVVLMKVVQHSKGERNFSAKFFEVDTAKINAIIIRPHGSKEEVHIVRNGKEWNLVKKNRTYRAEKNSVQTLLYELLNLKPDHLAAMDKSEWPQYQVTDTATRVRVEQEGKVVADFFLGKISFQQYQQTSYLRLNKDDNVYAVNGVPAMTFNRNADDFRNKIMVQINHVPDITKLSFAYPDSSFIMQKENNVWNVNGENLDSAKVASYLTTISSLYGSEFVDESVVPGSQKFSLRIEGKNLTPIELKAYSADAINQYVITSSMNPEGKFSGLKGDLAKKIFVGPSHFKATPKGKKK
jgi:hypothetical protein